MRLVRLAPNALSLLVRRGLLPLASLLLRALGPELVIRRRGFGGYARGPSRGYHRVSAGFGIGPREGGGDLGGPEDRRGRRRATRRRLGLGPPGVLRSGEGVVGDFRRRRRLLLLRADPRLFLGSRGAFLLFDGARGFGVSLRLFRPRRVSLGVILCLFRRLGVEFDRDPRGFLPFGSVPS